jgi:hypothetical protein
MILILVKMMGFKERPFDQPAYEQQEEEPTRVIIISCEGSNTEPEYFEAIKDKLKHHISSLIEIELVPKPTEASEPKDVLDNLESYVEKYDFNEGYDSLWLVCDREKVIARKTGKKGLLGVIPLCEEKGYSMALSNPLFEFWLLLHVVDITDYDHEILLSNEKVNGTRRFVDKELSDRLDGGFNKKKGRFNKEIVSLENIRRAIEQEQLFENDLTKIVDNLGGNISLLISEILSI